MVKTTPFEPEKYLPTATAQREFLIEAFASGDAGHIANALGIVARARGISKVAGDIGMTRAALYTGLTPSSDPKLSTVLGLLKSSGLAVTVKRAG
jgi:probable addiction module antidote protein